MRTTKLLVTILAAASIAGCATGSVRMVGDTTSYSSGLCTVTVYQTREAAVANGLRKERCVVEGTSAFSFDHSIEGAIKKNVSKICNCGVTKAYISSAHTQAELGIKSLSHVNLVGFE